MSEIVGGEEGDMKRWMRQVLRKESVPLKPLKENLRLCLQSASLMCGFDKSPSCGEMLLASWWSPEALIKYMFLTSASLFNFARGYLASGMFN